MSQILISAGNVLFRIMSMLILVNVIFSWIRPNRDNLIVNFIYNITEPMLAPFKKISIGGAVSFAPLLAILSIDYIIAPLYQFLIRLIFP